MQISIFVILQCKNILKQLSKFFVFNGRYFLLTVLLFITEVPQKNSTTDGRRLAQI